MRGTRGSSPPLITCPTYTVRRVVESPSWAQVVCCFSVQKHLRDPSWEGALEGTPELHYAELARETWPGEMS